MPAKIKLKIVLKGDVANVKSLMVHPMETGMRKDPDSGARIPAHYIKQVTFANNGKTVLIADCSTAVSRDPFFAFSFKGAKAGDVFTVSWVDTEGETASLEKVLA